MLNTPCKINGHAHASMVTARVKRHTFDAVPLLHPVQLLQFLQHVHSVVQEVDDDGDEDTEGEAPGGSCCCPAVGGVSAACHHKQPVKADQNAGQECV